MGLLPETEVEFKIMGNTVFLKRAENLSKRGSNLLDRMRRKATVKMTTDEILSLTRG